MNEFLDAALRLADAGFSVFPLLPHDKHPNAALLPRDSNDKPTWTPFQVERASIHQIEVWWSKAPNANIAIATGLVSNCFVLDIDGPQGLASLKEYGGIPSTPIVRTGSGFHVYFKHPGFPVPNRVGILPGIDIRGDGGYVVAPPSIHPSGSGYTWKVTYA